MQLTSYGAAGEVTGSKHLVAIGGRRVLLDCGLFQGRRQESQDRNNHFDFDPRTIDAVVVSHAHLDHVGMLPLLIREGYAGKMYATGATRDLAELILLDTAKIQTQDADFMNRHQYPEAPLHQPLYRVEDIPAVMARFERIPYTFIDASWHEIAPGVSLKLYDAGHILGSAVVVIRAQDQGQEKTLVYTGDLGRQDAPLLRDPDRVVETAGTLITESTYGHRQHHNIAEAEGKIVELVSQVMHTRGKIIVPAFSLGRTQELVYLLHRLTDAGRIPRIPIYVDSPLARRITTVYEQHQRDYDQRAGTEFSRPGEDPLVFQNLRYTESVEESKSLNNVPGPCMIISASGMVTAGRVIHHLEHTIEYPENVVLFTGYQADHTLGRKIIGGAHSLDIYGRHVPIRASIVTINDLSAHADSVELVNYAESIQGISNVFIVHSELEQATALQSSLQTDRPDWHVTISERGHTYDL